ncbi:hypothetical protein AVEN_13400-1, partial [Araneus ventricosus]
MRTFTQHRQKNYPKILVKQKVKKPFPSNSLQKEAKQEPGPTKPNARPL